MCLVVFSYLLMSQWAVVITSLSFPILVICIFFLFLSLWSIWQEVYKSYYPFKKEIAFSFINFSFSQFYWFCILFFISTLGLFCLFKKSFWKQKLMLFIETFLCFSDTFSSLNFPPQALLMYISQILKFVFSFIFSSKYFLISLETSSLICG